MNLRPKTKRRLVILLAGTALCFAAVSAVVTIQLHRHAAIRQGFRDKAMVLFTNRDYAGAMMQFRKYLIENTNDAPAIYAYAVSRSMVSEPDLKHLIEAKSIFNRYLEINPTDGKAQHKLLEIYRRIRYDAEAQSLAETLLAQNPDDVEALQAKLQSMVDHGQFAPALALSKKINALAPLQLDTQMTTYRLMAQLKVPAAQMVDRAEKMLAEHPGDPRFELLRAIAAGFDGDETGVEKWLTLAASRTPPDAQFTEKLLGMFERIGMFDQARELLAKSVGAFDDHPEMLAELVERQCEAGEISAGLDRLTSIDAADLRTDARILGLKALLFHTRGQNGDRAAADRIQAALAHRPGENVASAWDSLLKARFSDPRVEPKQAVALCQAALHRDPENAIGRYFLGLSYNDLGEPELAQQCWRLASRLAPSWAAPHLGRAQAFLDDGRIDQASIEAQAAHLCTGNSLAQSVMLALTDYAQLGSLPSTSEVDSLLADVQTIQKKNPNEPRTLAIWVDLLARAGQMRQALDVAQSALKAQPPLPPASLLQLARISAAQHLGIEPAIADLLEQHTPSTPQSIYDRALILAMLGERADGLRSLAGAQNVDGQLALTQYRQQIGDGDVVAAWASLADANPKNLTVQRAVLAASSAWSNRPLIDRSIDRIKSLTGEECISWRLARARWLLAGTDDVKTSASAAAAMMGEVVRIAPDLPEPQALWATALEKLGDWSAAIDRLRSAAALAPDDLDISIRLADRLQLHGNDEEARDILERLSQDHGVAPSAELRIARVLWRTGQSEAAIRVLDTTASKIAEPEHDLLLAQIYQSQGKIDQATRIYDDLIKAPLPTDSVMQAVASFHGWHGDADGGLRLLDRLSEGHELAVAEFDEAYGSPDAAMAHYRAAASAVPTDVPAWRALAGFQLRRGKYDDAAATAASGLAAAPGDVPLAAIKARVQTLSTISPSPSLKPLIVALSRHPADDAAVQALDAYAEDRADVNAPNQFLPRLRMVADSHPRFLPAQMVLVTEYFSSGRARQAEEIGMRAMQASPADADPARLMAGIWSSVDQWAKAHDAAEQWKLRSLDSPLNADVKVAETKLHLNDSRGALAQLAPYVEQAKSSPNQNVEVIRIYGAALAKSDRPADAQALLEPLLTQSPRWRAIWLDVGVDTSKNPTSAKAWIEKIAPQELAGSDEDKLALARAWYEIAQQFNDTALLGKARDILQPLADAGKSSSAVWLTLGSISQQMNDLSMAETDFRKSLQLDDKNANARNNLAYLEAARGGDLNEAKQLATASIAAAPTNSTFHCTLASIDAKTGNLEAAAQGFQDAVDLDAENSEALIGLADVQFRSGHRDQATATLAQADLVLQGKQPASENLRKQLDVLRAALNKSPMATSVTDVK